MLKETPRSLRQYFGLIAAISILFGGAGVYEGRIVPIAVALSFVTLIFGALYLYITIKFVVLLPKKPVFIKNVLTANLIFGLLMYSLSLFAGFHPGALIQIAIEVLVYFYLVKSVNRLSAEAAQSAGPVVTPPAGQETRQP